MGIQHSLTNQSNFFLLSILSLFYFPTVYPLISSTFKKSISFNPTPNTPIKMQYTLSTASALLAALSLTSAAPMPSTSTSTSSSSSGSSSSSVTIVLQLEGFDAASTLRANLDATTFVQAELPANIGPVDAGTVRNLANGAISIDVVGNGGNCQFFDAQGQTLNFGGDELVQVASFECQA